MWQQGRQRRVVAIVFVFIVIIIAFIIFVFVAVAVALLVDCLCHHHRRAALPPCCQAGCRRCVLATTNATPLLPLLLQPRHRRRHAILVTPRGTASTVATPLLELPHCQAGCHLCAAAVLAAALMSQPPPPLSYLTPPRLRCRHHHHRTLTPPLPLPH